MISVVTLSAVYCGIEPRSDQTKDYKTGIFFFSAKYTVLGGKSKDWLAQN
jgi:hypothetical protein